MALFSRGSSRQSPPRRRLDRDELSEPSTISHNFLRNRTLTGVRPASEEAPSERSRAHHLAQQRRRVAFVLGLLLVGIILTMLLLLQFTSRVTIAVSQSHLQKTLDSAGYTKTLNEYFDNHPVERLRFSLSNDQLLQFVVAEHPEVSSITQSTIWGIGDTQFTLSLRKPIAGWEIGGKQYYVDEQGVAFDKNYFDTPSVQIVDKSGVALEQGTAVTSTRFLSFIGKIVALSAGQGRTVTQAILPLGTAREVDIYLKSIRPYVKFSIDRGAGEQVEDMDRVLDYLKSKQIAPKYVDVRVETRAFYR